MFKKVILITGTRKGIGKYLVEYYCEKGFEVIGCSRDEADFRLKSYTHYCCDVSNEKHVKKMFYDIRKKYKNIDVLINNAGIASMNHIYLSPIKTVEKILNTNVIGTFLFCREGAKLMTSKGGGRIVNFATVATPLKLEGEAVYASSKAAIVSLTEIIARELGPLGITVNAVGPTPVKTDLIRSVPEEKMAGLIARQAIPRYGEFRDISNAIDFFIDEKSDFITGQTIYLGGV